MFVCVCILSPRNLFSPASAFEFVSEVCDAIVKFSSDCDNSIKLRRVMHVLHKDFLDVRLKTEESLVGKTSSCTAHKRRFKDYAITKFH